MSGRFKSWLWFGLLALVLTGTPAVQAQGTDGGSRPADALVLTGAQSIEAMQNVVDFINSQGGAVLVTFAPHALLVRLPEGGPADWAGQAGIRAVYTGAVDAAAIQTTYDEQAGQAARVWNNWQNSLAGLGELLGETPPNDALLPPELPGEIGPLDVPQSYQTSEYMYGSIQVDLILPESNGSLDTNRENWSTSRRDQVVSEVTAGTAWWASTATQGGRPGANLSFNITVRDPFNQSSTVSTRYEPIARPQTDQGLWIEEIMGHLGYSGYYYSAVRSFAHARRTSMGTKWAFVIFVVDSYNDSDNYFSDNSYFAYAYLNGPFMVMTYGNDGWGIGNMEMVTAHEMGHIFGALDEYSSSGCTTSQRSGYLNVANTNCENGSPTENSIMRSSGSQNIAYPNHLASTPVRGMVGWRDSDGDGLYDPVDTSPSILLNAYTPDPTSSTNLTYSGSTQDEAYPSPTHTSATINTISSVQYRVDGGTWQNCQAGDSSFNSWRENFTCSVGPLADGNRSIQVRSRNSVGNYSALAGDTVTVDAAPPSNPTTVTPGCTAGHNSWQNSCNDPFFTWSGASDSVTGVAGYQVYWGTNSAGTSTTWRSTASYDPAPVTDGTYYLRVRTKDGAGNWSSWTTLFILRYDNTAPAVQVTAPQANSYVGSSVTIQAAGTDMTSGMSNFQFFAGYDDGTGWTWHYLGSDTNGVDGWSQAWNATTVPEQAGISFFVYGWDQASNEGSGWVGDIALDRVPPSSTVLSLPGSLTSTTFIVNWGGSDTMSGLATYDIQYREDSGTWTDRWVATTDNYAWFTGSMYHTYSFRARARDMAGNQEAYPSSADTSVYIQGCSGDSYEEDDTYQAARWITGGGPGQSHTFCGAGDQDWLVFQAQAGRQYIIETSNLPYWTDTYLFLYGPNGLNYQAENDDIILGVNRASRITWTAPSSGNYYIMVRDWNSGTAGNGATYTILVGQGSKVYIPLVIGRGAAGPMPEAPVPLMEAPAQPVFFRVK